MLLDYARERRLAPGRLSRLAVVGWVCSFLTMPSCVMIVGSGWLEGNVGFALAPSVLTLSCCVVALIRIDRSAVPMRGRDMAIFGGALSVVAMLMVIVAKVLWDFGLGD